MIDLDAVRTPVVGEVLSPTHAKSVIPAKMRVLHVRAGEQGYIILIEIEPIRSKGRLYFRGVRTYDLAMVLKDLGRNRTTNLSNTVPPRPDAAASDADLDKKYLRRGQEMSGPRRDREERWAIIRPLVEDRDARQLLFDPQVRREKIAARAAELATATRGRRSTIAMIGELLNMYFAGGSTRGALTPFADAKGGRGKPHRQTKKKLGPKNRPTREGKTGEEGLILSEQDKDICGYAWRNYYVRGKTIAKALRRMWREFYSTVSTDSRGKTFHELCPVGQRPTRAQFIRWGQLRSPGYESWKAKLTKVALARLDRALFGTSDENITMIGQLGGMDSTSPDLHFVSVLNRLKRIGGAYRILLIDGRHGYIAGFYLGLEAPSATTVRLAVLHSLSDKKPWLKWLGLEDQDPDQWLTIQFARIIGDNTDLRCEEVEDWLESIDCGLQFVGVARSDLNAVVESGHHILHRSTDHNLHGTTHGRRTERGETPPDELARHTVIEAIRETARAIYAHNTMELEMIPTLEAHRELVAKGIKLTRANLTRWDIERGKVATSLMSIDEARAKLLMPIRGTFTKHGVKLLRTDRGDKREFVEPIRFIAKDKAIIARVLRAKVARGRARPEDFDDDFLHNPYEPNQIYFREPVFGKLITLDAKVRGDDSERLAECSLPDMVQLMEEGALDRFNARVSRDEALSDLEDGQDRTKEEADEAYEAALAGLPKKPSKASLKANKKENREAEKATCMYGMPIMLPECAAASEDAGDALESMQPEPPTPATESEAASPPSPPHKQESLPPLSPAPSSSPLLQTILQRISERSRHG